MLISHIYKNQQVVSIYYTRIEKELQDDTFRHYLSLLPDGLRLKNQHYRRWQDRHLHLAGKLLLMDALSGIGYEDSLKNLKYDQNNKPFIDPDIDFNISHSGNLVVCAIASATKLGVDVEKPRPIQFKHFRHIMNADEWHCIDESPKPYDAFFQYWVMKESIAKADNRGLGLDFKKFELTAGWGIYEQRLWHLTRLSLADDHVAYLATDREVLEKKFVYRDHFGSAESSR